ncbi:hypothetical protein [Streptomyces syringium]|uniref:hypothetical protein n=1 Tax=Streptomyces syringium TaxID=76729 RepID=UPI0033ED180E
MTDTTQELVGEVAAAASRLAQQQDIADVEEPQRALYLLAGAVGSLAAPVAALGAGTPEAVAAADALRAAERAVRAAQKALS